MPTPTPSRSRFRRHAKELAATLGKRELELKPKEFSTGSLGWYCNEKVQIVLDGQTFVCQLGFLVTIVGSKLATP